MISPLLSFTETTDIGGANRMQVSIVKCALFTVRLFTSLRRDLSAFEGVATWRFPYFVPPPPNFSSRLRRISSCESIVEADSSAARFSGGVFALDEDGPA